MHAYYVLMVPADCQYREYKQVVSPGHASASKYLLFLFFFPFLCLIVKHRIKHCCHRVLTKVSAVFPADAHFQQSQKRL